MATIDKIDKARLPAHVAIIMDGNGRWAKQKGKERADGHRAGVDTVHTIVEAAGKIGISYLTLYVFSKENWNRPEEEVKALMSLLIFAVAKETEELKRKNVRLHTIGDTDDLPSDTRLALENCIEDTAACTGLNLVLALNYSSRWEITQVAQQMAQEAYYKRLSIDDITEEAISKRLTTASFPDLDLLIRTGGEYRISNFLLWQAAYSELYFTDILWPDFSPEALYEAIYDYQRRERRYGMTSEQVQK